MPTKINTIPLAEHISLISEMEFFRVRLRSGVEMVCVGSQAATPTRTLPTSRANILPGFRGYSPPDRSEIIPGTMDKASLNSVSYTHLPLPPNREV